MVDSFINLWDILAHGFLFIGSAYQGSSPFYLVYARLCGPCLYIMNDISFIFSGVLTTKPMSSALCPACYSFKRVTLGRVLNLLQHPSRLICKTTTSVDNPSPGRDRKCSHQRQSSSPFSSATDVLPTQAQVVICGAGIVGNSVAYHLVQNGWKDIVVIDQEQLV